MSEQGNRRRPSGRRKYTPRRKVCIFTAEGIKPDYKDIKRLQRMVSDRGKILPRRRTGTCAKYQRKLTSPSSGRVTWRCCRLSRKTAADKRRRRLVKRNTGTGAHRSVPCLYIARS